MTDGEVVALLRELLAETRAGRVEVAAELRGIREALEQRAPPRPLDVRDRRLLAALLPVVAAQFAADFECWELLDVVEAGGMAGADMRLALGGLSAHRTGKLLRKAADAGGAFAGFRVVAVARGRWRLIADASAFSTAPAEGNVAIVRTSGGAR